MKSRMPLCAVLVFAVNAGCAQSTGPVTTPSTTRSPGLASAGSGPLGAAGAGGTMAPLAAAGASGSAAAGMGGAAVVMCGGTVCMPAMLSAQAKAELAPGVMLVPPCCVTATNSCGFMSVSGVCAAPPPAVTQCPGKWGSSGCCITATNRCGVDYTMFGVPNCSPPGFLPGGDMGIEARNCDGTPVSSAGSAGAGGATSGGAGGTGAAGATSAGRGGSPGAAGTGGSAAGAAGRAGSTP